MVNEKDIERWTKQMYTMFKMQNELDRYIERKHDVSIPNVEKFGDMYMATLDEIGEFTHELKPNWVYWKENPGIIDHGKALEELVDIWHFILSKYLVHCAVDEGVVETVEAFKDPQIMQMDKAMRKLTQSTSLKDLVNVTNMVGFTMDDIFECYLKKNQVNIERQNNGY